MPRENIGLANGFCELVGRGPSRDGRGRLGDLLKTAFASVTQCSVAEHLVEGSSGEDESCIVDEAVLGEVGGAVCGVGDSAKGFWFLRERADKGADAGGCCPPAPPAEGKGG